MAFASTSNIGGGARAVQRCRELAVPPYSEDADGIYRGYLTPAHAATCRKLQDWMREAGMTTRIDPAGNVIGRLAGDGEGPILLIGSHIDSVRDAGAFDGPLGVMLGIECAQALRDKGVSVPFTIDVIAFGDEEGSRFPASMLASRAVAGTLHADELAISDAAGVSLDEALAAFGIAAEDYLTAAYPPGSVRAFLEAHIEQGPILEAEALPLGIVTAIAGQRRLSVTLTGVAGHAGTSAMHLRRDALAAASEAVLSIERIARERGDDLVATVGSIVVAPGSSNVVPGRAEFTIDVRAGSDSVRDAARDRILDALDTIAATRGVGLKVQETQVLAASPCDPALVDGLALAVASVGVSPRRLVSGAGHDAMVMAAFAPTVMLFIRCTGGISHNPAEDVIIPDVELALQAMLRFMEDLFQ
jgi:allantoate deiminase